MNQLSSTSSLAADIKSFDSLRSSAARDPKAVVREAAKQFEMIFMQQLMKSMREATVASGMLDNAGTKMGTEMLDAQFANKMSGLPGGLSDVIAKQLERSMVGVQTPAARAAAPSSAAGAAEATASGKQGDFVRVHGEAAKAAEAETGIPAAFMVAQAAHESGWGRREIRNADGSSSHNVFGIKASPGWKGAVAEVMTTEYIGGQARKVVAKFRSYESYDAAFADYARMMKESPRYSQVVANADSAQGFAQGLQRAGYATDPAYAAKLTRVINTTLRLQRAA